MRWRAITSFTYTPRRSSPTPHRRRLLRRRRRRHRDRGDAPDGDGYTLFSLPPNFVGTVREVRCCGRRFAAGLEPHAGDHGGAYPSPSPEKSSGLSKLMGSAAAATAMRLIPDFLPEDKAICERGQRAATGDFELGTLVPRNR